MPKNQVIDYRFFSLYTLLVEEAPLKCNGACIKHSVLCTSLDSKSNTQSTNWKGHFSKGTPDFLHAAIDTFCAPKPQFCYGLQTLSAQIQNRTATHVCLEC